jgi:RNA polymerase sigma-70 factor (ECF subfamily)
VTLDYRFGPVLEAAQSGEEWAFAALFEEMQPRLLRYLGARASTAADDIASETWLAAAKGLRSFSGGEATFRGWLFTIARRRLVAHWRDRGAHPSEPLERVASVEAGRGCQGARPGNDPQDLVLAASEGVAACRAVAEALTSDQADVVLLRVVGGLSVAQVAQLLEKRPATVRVLQHKALRTLADRFTVEALTF